MTSSGRCFGIYTIVDDTRRSIGVRRAFHIDFAQREQGVAMMISPVRDLSRMTADGRERDVS